MCNATEYNRMFNAYANFAKSSINIILAGYLS